MSAIPDGLWAGLDRTLPIALLPVRLEVRSGQRTEHDEIIPTLRIRIYPDEISVPGRAVALRPDELAAGQRFWATVAAIAAAPTPPGELVDLEAIRVAQMAAWEVLTREVGIERTPHVARLTRPGAPAPRADPGSGRAVLLPDAWVVFGHVDGEVVLSEHVPVPSDSVAMAPSGRTTFDLSLPHLVADPELRWITDFDAALLAGMALTVDLVRPGTIVPPWAKDGRLDSLVVVGVRDTADPSGEAGLLSDLIAAHGAVDRVALTRRGTPTNRLRGRPSGWSSELDPFGAFDRVLDPPSATAGPVPDGALEAAAGTVASDVLAAALGVDRSTFADLDGAADISHRHARDMAEALFPVTYGEALRTLLAPDTTDPETMRRIVGQLDAARSFALDHVARFVRGGGPLPGIRVGRQPYGVLPITPLRSLAPTPADRPGWARLVGLLRRLRPFWEQAAAAVPSLEAGTDAPDAATRIMRVLQQGPVPHPAAYTVRRTASARLQSSERSFALSWRNSVFGALVRGGTPFEQVVRSAPLAVGDGTGSLGAAVAGQLPAGATTDAVVSAVLGAAQQAAAVAAISAIVDHEVTGFDASTIGGPDPVVMGSDLAAPTTAVGLVRVPPSTLLQVLTGIAGQLVDERRDAAAFSDLRAEFERQRGEYQQRITDYGNAAVQAAAGTEIAQTFPNFTQVSQLDQPTMSSGVPGAEGFFGSWWYEMPPSVPDPEPTDAPFGAHAAAARIEAARLDDEDIARLLGETLAPASSRFDAWATSLATRRLADQRAARPDGVQLGCWSVLVDVSWTPTPTTSAGPVDWPEPGKQEPVRVLTDPVGYVHAPSLDHARTAGVLRAAERAHRGSASTLTTLDLTSRRTRAARDVLQAVGNGQPLGAALGVHVERALGAAQLQRCVAPLRAAFPQHRREGAGGTVATGPDDAVVPFDVVDGLDVWQGQDQVATVCPDGGAPLATVLAQLDDLVDAVADVFVAQGVHDLVGGRPTRAGATFGALADATRPPLDLDVLTTPRSATTITHRVLLALPPAAETAPTGWRADAVRARMAPSVERWVARLLGDPSAVQVQVAGQGAPAAPITIASLGCCALDLVAEVDVRGGDRFTDRIGAATGVTAGLQVTGVDDRWMRMQHLAEGIRAVLAAARPAVPADVGAGPQHAVGVDDPGPPAVTAADIDAEVGAVAVVLQAVSDAVDAIEAGAPASDPRLAVLADLGIAGAVAARRVLADVAELVPGVDGTWTDRLRAAVSAAVDPVGLLVGVGRSVAGEAVVITPALAGVDAAALLPPASAAPAELGRWLERTAQVRDRLAAYDDLRLYVEAAGGSPEPLSVAQLPPADPPTWIGGRDLDAPGDQPDPRPERPTTHLLLAGAPSDIALVLDEFVEAVPDLETTTGLAVHADAPRARPPQTILLAVHPGADVAWSPDLLDEIVREAVALARLRLVEPEDLAAVGLDAFLPLTAPRSAATMTADPATPALVVSAAPTYIPADELPEAIEQWTLERWHRWAQEQDEMQWLDEAVTAEVGELTVVVTATGTEITLATGTDGTDVTVGTGTDGTDVTVGTGTDGTVVDAGFTRLQRTAHRLAGPAEGAG